MSVLESFTVAPVMETENVNIKIEEIKEQITVGSSETFNTGSVKEKSDNLIEKLVDGQRGFAAKVVEASLEAAKQQLMVEAKSNLAEAATEPVPKTQVEPEIKITVSEVQMQNSTEETKQDDLEKHVPEQEKELKESMKDESVEVQGEGESLVESSVSSPPAAEEQISVEFQEGAPSVETSVPPSAQTVSEDQVIVEVQDEIVSVVQNSVSSPPTATVAEDQIHVEIQEEVVTSEQTSVSSPPAPPPTRTQTMDDVESEEVELECNAAELVAATLEKAKEQLGVEVKARLVPSPSPSPPPLPGSAPPPLPSMPPPPVPSGEATEEKNQEISEDVTPQIEAKVQDVMSKVKESPVEMVPDVALADVEETVVTERQEPEKQDVEPECPPLPAGPPPMTGGHEDDVIIQTTQSVVVESAPPGPSNHQEQTTTQAVQDTPSPSEQTGLENENNEWVQEIDKIAAQESKFDMLINFDSKTKLQLDAETPTSDSDSGVSLHTNTSPVTDPSAIASGAAENTETGEAKVASDSSTASDVVKMVTTSVEPVVESAVGVDEVRERKDTGTDSGVESATEMSNKTVTVQYSSNVSSAELHEQDSSCSDTSLHDSSFSPVPPKTLSSVESVNSEKRSQEKSAPINVSPVSDVSLSTEIQTHVNNVSLQQVSNSPKSSQNDAPKDSDSLKSESARSPDQIFSSTPTKDHANISVNKESAFEADVSSIQDSSSKLNNSQNLSVTVNKSSVSSSSSTLNTSFSVSPKSKSSTSKRRWKVVSNSSGGSDLSNGSQTELSDTSVIPKEELLQLIELANQTMDKTGNSLEDEVVVLVLSRETETQDLGIELRDGILKSKVICKVKPDSLAEKDNRVQLKDCLLSVNGKSVVDSSAEEVMKTLAEPSLQVTLVLSRRGDSSRNTNGMTNADTSINGNGVDTPPPPMPEGPGVFEVVMKKGVTGVGFCLEGGKGSPKGDMPIFIRRIFKGGPADKCGQLKVHDEILKVNDTDFTTLRHYEAWNHLKFLPDGDVKIIIQRK